MRWACLTSKQQFDRYIERRERKAEARARKAARKAAAGDPWHVRFAAWRVNRKRLRNRKRIQRQAARDIRLHKWNDKNGSWCQWFSWCPVWDRKNGYAMWWETVLRKRAWPAEAWYDKFFGWEYRPITLLPNDLGVQTDE